MWKFREVIGALIVVVVGVASGRFASDPADATALPTPSLRTVPGLQEPLVAAAPTSRLDEEARAAGRPDH